MYISIDNNIFRYITLKVQYWSIVDTNKSISYILGITEYLNIKNLINLQNISNPCVIIKVGKYTLFYNIDILLKL